MLHCLHKLESCFHQGISSLQCQCQFQYLLNQWLKRKPCQKELEKVMWSSSMLMLPLEMARAMAKAKE